MPSQRRSWPARVLVPVAVLATAVVGYAHWNPRRYVSLRPFAGFDATVAVALAVPVLLTLAVLVALTPGGAGR